MLSSALVLLLLGGRSIVVAEAVIRPQDADAAFGAEVARALGAQMPSEVARLLDERLPAVAATSRAEPVIEADRLVEQGRDAYIEGRFAQAIDNLTRARDVLHRAVESLEEERKGGETLFRAFMYLAFTLRAQGGAHAPRAVEIMKEGIRTFPTLEPSFSEFGPENVRFYRQVKTELDRGPMCRLRVRSKGESANVYLNGRLVGVTPLDLQKVYVGVYVLHLRRGSEPSRLHAIELKPGDNEIQIDLALERALRTDREVSLAYESEQMRQVFHRHHAAQLARLLGAAGTLIYWFSRTQVHMVLVESDGSARRIACGRSEAPKVAAALRDGATGEVVESEEPSQRRRWTWIIGGVAAGALVGGGVLAISAHSDFSSLNDKYPAGGPIAAGDVDTRDSGATKQLAANVLFAVAGAAAVTTALLYFYEGNRGDERFLLTPVIGQNFAGAEWQVRF